MLIAMAEARSAKPDLRCHLPPPAGRPPGKSAEGADKFATLRIKPLEAPADAGGAPAVADSMAVLWCVVRDSRETGDHLLFTGEVRAHQIDSAKIDALLRFRRRYAHIGHITSEESPEGYPT